MLKSVSAKFFDFEQWTLIPEVLIRAGWKSSFGAGIREDLIIRNTHEHVRGVKTRFKDWVQSANYDWHRRYKNQNLYTKAIQLKKQTASRKSEQWRRNILKCPLTVV